MHNAFTVDLEDWYCSRALEGIVPRSEWGNCPSRVGYGARLLLDLFERHSIEATFFVLGYVAEREPELIREIADRGHEIATHGYFHQHLAEITPGEFAHDLDRAIAVTERAGGRKVTGYRAPIFSVTGRTAGWALETLSSRRMLYDSSIFPMQRHPEYGMAEAPLDIFRHANGIIEVPISCVHVAGVRFPATGGGYFRHLPYPVTRSLLRRCNRQGRPVIFYIHPWEIDPEPPRLPLPMLRRLRHYHGMVTTFGKLERLVEDFSFTSMRGVLGNAGYDCTG